MIIKSLWKALDVLEYFTSENPEAGISEISEALGLNPSNVCDIVKTFERRGYLQQNEQNKKYHLGFQILQRYYAFDYSDAAGEIIRPHLKTIAKQTGEMVYYGAAYQDRVIYLDQAVLNVDTFLMKKSAIGSTAPLHCTGLGKALLAYQEENFIDEIIARGLDKFTDDTICRGDILRQELALIRQRGYSVDNMEHEFGVRCVGMAILDRKDMPLGAISVTGPSLRFDEQKIEQFANILRGHVEEIRSQMFL
ncbi:MAG TPA: IclR family transcriptional regulator [Lachnospiraceae bacterium]|nr:IclR family transcriptional regulator [Lachnospiraceae bacterium]